MRRETTLTSSEKSVVSPAYSPKSPLKSRFKRLLKDENSDFETNVLTTTECCVGELERVFRYFDENGDGKISASELQSYSQHDSSIGDVNVSVSAQTTVVVVDTSLTASLLHQSQTTIETSSFHIERDLLPEGQETSPGVATGVASQPPHQPSPPVAENETPDPDLKTEFKVATWVSMISSGATLSVVSGLVGNEKKATLTHKTLFRAFSILNYISLVLGVGLIVLILTRPTIPGFVKVTKFVMWIAIGSITYALGCATCLLLPKLVEIVLVLVVPLLIVCLITALSFGPGCRN